MLYLIGCTVKVGETFLEGEKTFLLLFSCFLFIDTLSLPHVLDKT